MSTAPITFDPYQDWLGIAPHERPVDHYRLLGLARFEMDVARIAKAADERMALVRSYQTGPRGKYTQQLLNEISAARVCLLSPATKAAYDLALHQMLAQATARAYANTVALAAPLAPPIAPPPPPVMKGRLPQGAYAPRSPVLERSTSSRHSWWRPLEFTIAAAVLALAAIVGWSMWKDRWNAGEQPEEIALVEEAAESEPPPPAAVVLLQEGSGEVNLSPSTAQLSGGVKLQTARTEQVLAQWMSAEDAAQWRFRLILPGKYCVVFTYATVENALDGELEVTLDGDAEDCELRPTGALTRFDAASLGVELPEAGEHTLRVRPTRNYTEDWLHVKSVQLVPVNPPIQPETFRPPTAAQSDG